MVLSQLTNRKRCGTGDPQPVSKQTSPQREPEHRRGQEACGRVTPSQPRSVSSPGDHPFSLLRLPGAEHHRMSSHPHQWPKVQPLKTPREALSSSNFPPVPYTEEAQCCTGCSTLKGAPSTQEGKAENEGDFGVESNKFITAYHLSVTIYKSSIETLLWNLQTLRIHIVSSCVSKNIVS